MLVSAALVALCASVAAQPLSQVFTERPGVLEFSGRLIVRPLQPVTGRDRGLSPSAIEVLRARATGALQPHLIEYAPETDEYVVSLPPGRTENDYAAELMATGDYEYAVPDWRCFPVGTIPNDPSYGMQWHHTKVHSPQAWSIHAGGPSLVIAVVDGGVQLDHPDLVAALVPGYNSSDRLEQSAGGQVGDVDGHGTFVAGLVGAVGNNGVDVAGMGWRFSLMPIRYYNSPGGGYLSDILDGVRWAVDHGARCVNVSQSGVEYAPVQTTGAYVRGQGSLLFWAAGNDGRDLSWFDWPDVIVVGATDTNDQRPGWSAFGLAVDVFAPGADIISTAMPVGLAIGSGTSAATPIATGICGLVWSLSPSLQPQQVESSLFAGCVDLGTPGNDLVWGFGRVDSYATLTSSPPYLPYNTCFTSPNSVDPVGSIMAYAGTQSVANNDFVLIASACPPSTYGVFYFGGAETYAGFGNGYRCVASPVIRLGVTQVNVFGDGVYNLDLNAPPVVGQISAGQTKFFQFWYRNPAAGGASFNLSDALAVPFWP